MMISDGVKSEADLLLPRRLPRSWSKISFAGRALARQDPLLDLGREVGNK